MPTLLCPLVLASESPRRRDILTTLGFAFDVVPSETDERVFANEEPLQYVKRVARAKASDVERRLHAARPNDRAILSADTIVTLDGFIFGKPSNERENADMLRALAGRFHEVVTCVVLRKAGADTTRVVRTRVMMRSMADATITAYASSKEGLDKAGGYAVQGLGSGLIAEIAGSYLNVVGLPALETLELLEETGVLGSWP